MKAFILIGVIFSNLLLAQDNMANPDYGTFTNDVDKKVESVTDETIGINGLKVEEISGSFDTTEKRSVASEVEEVEFSPRLHVNEIPGSFR